MNNNSTSQVQFSSPALTLKFLFSVMFTTRNIFLIPSSQCAYPPQAGQRLPFLVHQFTEVSQTLKYPTSYRNFCACFLYWWFGMAAPWSLKVTLMGGWLKIVTWNGKTILTVDKNEYRFFLDMRKLWHAFHLFSPTLIYLSFTSYFLFLCYLCVLLLINLDYLVNSYLYSWSHESSFSVCTNEIGIPFLYKSGNVYTYLSD